MDKLLSAFTIPALQQSTLTYSVDHTVLETRVNAHRLFPLSGFGNINIIDYKIKVEILNIQIIRSTAQVYGAGE